MKNIISLLGLVKSSEYTPYSPFNALAENKFEGTVVFGPKYKYVDLRDDSAPNDSNTAKRMDSMAEEISDFVKASVRAEQSKANLRKDSEDNLADAAKLSNLNDAIEEDEKRFDQELRQENIKKYNEAHPPSNKTQNT